MTERIADKRKLDTVASEDARCLLEWFAAATRVGIECRSQVQNAKCVAHLAGFCYRANHASLSFANAHCYRACFSPEPRRERGGATAANATATEHGAAEMVSEVCKF